MLHAPITRRILHSAYAVYNRLGSGFPEHVYSNAIACDLEFAGLRALREFPITVRYRGKSVGEFRADLVVENLVVVEVKAREALHPAHASQVLNYLRASDLEVGLLLNFGFRTVNVVRLVNEKGKDFGAERAG